MTKYYGWLGVTMLGLSFWYSTGYFVSVPFVVGFFLIFVKAVAYIND